MERLSIEVSKTDIDVSVEVTTSHQLLDATMRTCMHATTNSSAVCELPPQLIVSVRCWLVGAGVACDNHSDQRNLAALLCSCWRLAGFRNSSGFRNLAPSTESVNAPSSPSHPFQAMHSPAN